MKGDQPVAVFASFVASDKPKGLLNSLKFGHIVAISAWFHRSDVCSRKHRCSY